MKLSQNFTAKLYDPILHFAVKSIRMEIMNALLDYKEKNILDLCCGTGNQLKLLSRNGFKKLHCLDSSSSMLKIAKKHRFPINLYHEDATKTKFKDETFDAIIVCFSLHEKDRKIEESLLEEAYRLLKSTGTIIIVDYIFDDKTEWYSKMLIKLIERIAGGEHYKNFIKYLTHDGFQNLVKENKFKLLRCQRLTSGAVMMARYKKI